MMAEQEITIEHVHKALEQFADAVRRHYGPRLSDIMLFGSRARGDDGPDSDADVVVVLEDGDWRFWHEKMELAGLAYEPLIEHGLAIQPWPVSRSEWEAPARHRNPYFVETIKNDARHFAEAA